MNLKCYGGGAGITFSTLPLQLWSLLVCIPGGRVLYFFSPRMKDLCGVCEVEQQQWSHCVSSHLHTVASHIWQKRRDTPVFRLSSARVGGLFYYQRHPFINRGIDITTLTLFCLSISFLDQVWPVLAQSWHRNLWYDPGDPAGHHRTGDLLCPHILLTQGRRIYLALPHTCKTHS